MSYTPDHGFVKKLKEIDPKLGCFFNTDGPFVVVTYKRATGEPAPIYTCKSKDGGFRIPNDRDIDKIRQGDQNQTSIKDRLGKTAKYMSDREARIKKEAHDNIMGATRDNKIQLMREYGRIYNPGGKGNRPFRQLTPKPKGKIFT
jgi:hypothetical protein